jgi:hypothetical protein
MTEEIFDVILLSTGNFHANLEMFQKHRPPEEDFYLNEQMWVGSLPKGISSKLIFDACDSPGWHFHSARQYGMRYAFCRKVEPAHEDYYHWDRDQFIGQLSCSHASLGPQQSARPLPPGSTLQTAS